VAEGYKEESPSSTGFLPQAAASQYPALKGLLMRSASGDTSTNLSVGIFSAVGSTGAMSMPTTGTLPS